jgi:hypothetical protein
VAPETEQSGVATLPGGAAALPGVDPATNVSAWTRFPANPVIRNGGNTTDDTAMASDPKVRGCWGEGQAAGKCERRAHRRPQVYWDASLGGGAGAWVMLYFGVGSRGGAAICVAFSWDAREWVKASTPLYEPGGHPGGLGHTQIGPFPNDSGADVIGDNPQAVVGFIHHIPIRFVTGPNERPDTAKPQQIHIMFQKCLNQKIRMHHIIFNPKTGFDFGG